MIIKKFQGKTEADVVDLAKAELGPSVVIMNVKTLKQKGIFRLFKSPKVEVTVALEEESERISAQKSEKPKVPVQVMSKDIIMEEEVEDSKAIEKKLESLHSLIEKRLEKETEEGTSEDIKEKPSEMVRFLKLVYNTLIDNEVDEKYANEILDEVEKMNKKGMTIDYMLSNIYQKLILKFGQSSMVEAAENGPKVVFFVGPTGVGKTTTIAKIASSFSVNEKKKIALLTTDTYRIAAAEQLRTYANILDTPFRVIYTNEEMEDAFRDFEKYDYFFVDTAGHSHHNETLKDSIQQLVHSLDGKAEIEVYLVVSATTKYRDLQSIADTYKEMIDYKLIFTKLDETTSLGNLLNLKLYTGAEMSYITCGQNVPDDIAKFNPQATVKQLLGGK